MNFLLKINLRKILLVFIFCQLTYQETNEEFGCLEENLFQIPRIKNDVIFEKVLNNFRNLICRKNNVEYRRLKAKMYQVRRGNIQEKKNIPIVKWILNNSKSGEFANFCNVVNSKIFIIKKATEKEIEDCQKLQNYSFRQFGGKIKKVCLNQINSLFTKKTKQEEDVDCFEKSNHLKDLEEYADDLKLGEKGPYNGLKKLSTNLYAGFTIFEGKEPGVVIKNKIMMYRLNNECQFLRSVVENYLSKKFRIKNGNFTQNFILNQFTHFIYHDDKHDIYYFVVVRRKVKSNIQDKNMDIDRLI